MPPADRPAPRDGALPAAFITILVILAGLLLLPYGPANLTRGILPSILVVTLVLTAVWITLRLMGPIFERIAEPKIGSHAQARSLWRFLSYIVLGVVLLGLTFSYLVDVTSTALGLGLLGAALAFVLQKPLLNLVGWMLIHYRQVYRIGDRVEMGGVTGVVTDVNLMYTDLQEFGGWMHGDTFTGRLVTVPNATVVESATKNYTRDFPLVWDEVEVLVTYDSDVDVAKEHMTQAAMEVVGGVMSENYARYRKHLVLRDLGDRLITAPEIRMDFADSGVKLWVLYFCPPEIRRRMKAQIVEKIWRRFSEDERVEMAYPHLAIVPGTKRGVATKIGSAPVETRFEVADPAPPRKEKTARGARSRP
ncbi:MAG TPA: mechanosensitive ion channel domain-containing protein [Thermoplasmata archaeon]|nr:mechanosensitive ion channel domain-containing protein [Thermoplasmata archaeon]